MISCLFTFLAAASIAVAMTPFSRWLSLRVGAVDVPDARKVHQGNMPRMGGVAIVAAFLVPVAGILFFEGGVVWKLASDKLMLSALFGGGLVIALLGALDDMFGLKPRHKFLVQFAVAVVAWTAGFRFERMGLPFLGSVEFPIWLDFALTVIWIAGVVNALNLIDGLDGLAAGVTFFVAATNLVLAVQNGNVLGALFAATLAGAVLGFLLFNWNPAIVFMGDTGSMFLGYVLATTSIMTGMKTSTAMAMVVPIAALGVPVIDTLLSMVRRFLEKRPLFSPDKGHLHHRLLKAGLTQRRAVLAIYALSIVFAGTAIAMTAAKDAQAAVAVGVLVVMVVGIVRFFGFFNFSHAMRGVFHRSPMAECLRPHMPGFTARAYQEQIDFEDLWQAFCELGLACHFRDLGFRTAGLKPRVQRYRRLLPAGSAQCAKAGRKGFIKIKSSAPIHTASYVELVFVVPGSLGKLTPQADTLFQLVADTVAGSLGRIWSAGKWPQSAPDQDVELGSSDSWGTEADSGEQESPAQACAEPDEIKEAAPEPDSDSGEILAHNPRLDAAWQTLLAMSRDGPFLVVEWKSAGLQPPDRRRFHIDPKAGRDRIVVWRSVAITSMSFVEIGFHFHGREDRPVPAEIKTLLIQICSRLRKDLRRVGG